MRVIERQELCSRLHVNISNRDLWCEGHASGKHQLNAIKIIISIRVSNFDILSIFFGEVRFLRDRCDLITRFVWVRLAWLLTSSWSLIGSMFFFLILFEPIESKMKNDQVIAWNLMNMAPMKYFSNKFSDYSVFITYLKLKNSQS